MRRAAVVAVAAVVLVLAGTACGVSPEASPRGVEPPRGLYPLPGISSAPASEVGAAEEPLCFVRDQKLVRTVRRVGAWPTIETQVQHLLAGPDRAEQAAGLTSAVAGTAVVGIRLSRGEVTLELGDNPEGTGRTDDVFAVGQIVCALSTRPDVTGVSFTRHGQRLTVPRSDGSLTDAPVTAADYASLISP